MNALLKHVAITAASSSHHWQIKDILILNIGVKNITQNFLIQAID